MAPISKYSVALFGLFAALPCAAIELECHQNERTDAMTCIDPRAVTERDGIRSAKLYMGGPKEVKATSFTVATNCRTGVTHLKDRQGVSFAGGDGNETKTLRALRGLVCDAPVKKKKP